MSVSRQNGPWLCGGALRARMTLPRTCGDVVDGHLDVGFGIWPNLGQASLSLGLLSITFTLCLRPPPPLSWANETEEARRGGKSRTLLPADGESVRHGRYVDGGT